MSRPVQAGDLAIIVRGGSEVARQNIGKLVRVLGPAQSGFHHGNHFGASCDTPDAWFIQSVGLPLFVLAAIDAIAQVRIAATTGASLHPLEHPGDNVADESKAWLPPVPPRRQVKP